MKIELSKISKHLEQGTINEKEARTLLLALLGYTSEPPTEFNQAEIYHELVNEIIEQSTPPAEGEERCPKCNAPKPKHKELCYGCNALTDPPAHEDG